MYFAILGPSDSCQFTFDRNTVNKKLWLADQEVAKTIQDQKYPSHPERFDERCLVLCREGVSGRAYWEVEWSGTKGVYIAVSYKDVCRKGGDECIFGNNKQSWSLCCTPPMYYFRHNNAGTDITGPSSPTIGVYVDHCARPETRRAAKTSEGKRETAERRDQKKERARKKERERERERVRVRGRGRGRERERERKKERCDGGEMGLSSAGDRNGSCGGERGDAWQSHHGVSAPA